MIAFDATTNSGLKTNSSSFSWAHTCTGSNLILVVGVFTYDITAGDREVSGITYNGVALTKINHSLNTNHRVELWYLINPATGSNTVAVTMAGVNSKVGAGAISLTGAAQSGQPEATGTATGSSTSPSVDVTTVADNSWVIDCVIHQFFTTRETGDCPNSAVGAGQTERYFIGDDAAEAGGAGSTEGPKTPAEAVTMSWGSDAGCGAGAWATIASSFAPSAEGTTYAEQITATITLVDIVPRSVKRALSQTITITDALIKSIKRTMTEAIILADSILRIIKRTITETAVFVDSAVKTAKRLLTQTITLADTFAGVRKLVKELLESVAIVDTLSRSISRAFSEVIAFVGTFSSSIPSALKSIGQFTLYSLYDITKTINDSSKKFTMHLKKTLHTLNNTAKKSEIYLSERAHTLNDATKKAVLYAKGRIKIS